MARAVRQEQVKARQKEIDELRKLGQSTIITAGNVDDVRPDHVAEAARRRGARAFLSLNDHSILFFRVEDLHADATWIAAPVPSRTDKDAVPKLFAESLLAAQERFADFCAEIEPHGTTQSAVLSTYTEVLSMFSQTDNTVTLCGGESVEVPLHAVPEHRPCELCTEQATCLLFQCSSCHRLVRSCAKHYSDLVNPSRVCPNHQK